MSSGLIRSRQAAARLGVCRHTLHDMVRRGDLRAVKLGRRWLAFEVEEIERFIRARQVCAGRKGNTPAPNAVQAQA